MVLISLTAAKTREVEAERLSPSAQLLDERLRCRGPRLGRCQLLFEPGASAPLCHQLKHAALEPRAGAVLLLELKQLDLEHGLPLALDGPHRLVERQLAGRRGQGEGVGCGVAPRSCWRCLRRKRWTRHQSQPVLVLRAPRAVADLANHVLAVAAEATVLVAALVAATGQTQSVVRAGEGGDEWWKGAGRVGGR